MSGPRPSIVTGDRSNGIVAVGFATSVIALNYIDRSTLSVGNVLIRREFGISATAIGALQSGWSLAYAFAQIPVGFMATWLYPRYSPALR